MAKTSSTETDETKTGASVSFEIANLLDAKALASVELIRAIKMRPLEDKSIDCFGYITGRVTGLSYRSNQYSDEPAYVLKGTFKGIPTDPARKEIRAEYCILPRSMNAAVVAAVIGDGAHAIDKAPKRGQKLDVPYGNEIRFAVEVGCRRSDTEIGYEYVNVMHGSDGFNVHDPLEELNQFLPEHVQQRLPAPVIAAVPQQARIAAPEKPVKRRASK
jgi:hypothetical protein